MLILLQHFVLLGGLFHNLNFNIYGDALQARAICYKSSLVPHCGLFASIPIANTIKKSTMQEITLHINDVSFFRETHKIVRISYALIMARTYYN